MEKPDVVLLSVDSLRFDAVFTDEGRVEERLDGVQRLVDRGVSFDNAWATASYTVGSVRSILSGSYQWSYDGEPYEPDRPHIAEQFKELGYATAGFHSNPLLHGKYGWGRGFDHYFTGGFEGSGKKTLDVIQNFVTQFDVTKRIAGKAMSIVGRRTGVDIRGRGKPYISADKLHEQAVEWADEQQGPVFLWIHYMDVHNPWYPHEGTVSADIEKSKLMRSFYKARDNPSEVTVTDRRRLQTAYRGSLQDFDRQLDSFLDDIEQTLDEPVICLTSDHGELFGEDGKYCHPPSVHPKLLHVPLIFASPSELPEEHSPVSTVDVLPTLLSAAGRNATSRIDGRNLFTDELAGRKEIFGASNDRIRVLSDDESSVYDVPYRGPRSKLSDVAQRHVETLNTSTVNGPTIDDDDGELDEQLEALGYK